MLFSLLNYFECKILTKNSLTVICENTVNNLREFHRSLGFLVQAQKHQFSFYYSFQYPFFKHRIGNPEKCQSFSGFLLDCFSPATVFSQKRKVYPGVHFNQGTLFLKLHYNNW